MFRKISTLSILLLFSHCSSRRTNSSIMRGHLEVQGREVSTLGNPITLCDVVHKHLTNIGQVSFTPSEYGEGYIDLIIEAYKTASKENLNNPSDYLVSLLKAFREEIKKSFTDSSSKKHLFDKLGATKWDEAFIQNNPGLVRDDIANNFLNDNLYTLSRKFRFNDVAKDIHKGNFNKELDELDSKLDEVHYEPINKNVKIKTLYCTVHKNEARGGEFYDYNFANTEYLKIKNSNSFDALLAFGNGSRDFSEASADILWTKLAKIINSIKIGYKLDFLVIKFTGHGSAQDNLMGWFIDEKRFYDKAEKILIIADPCHSKKDHKYYNKETSKYYLITSSSNESEVSSMTDFKPEKLAKYLKDKTSSSALFEAFVRFYSEHKDSTPVISGPDVPENKEGERQQPVKDYYEHLKKSKA